MYGANYAGRVTVGCAWYAVNTQWHFYSF